MSSTILRAGITGARRVLLTNSFVQRQTTFSSKFQPIIVGNFSTTKKYESSVNDVVASAPEPDSLIKTLNIEVQGHDRAVIESYEKFMSMAMKGFELEHVKIIDKPKFIWKRTVLKSVFVHKKHRVQYESRNHYKVFEINYLTGSTASTFLEYIQRNLPEGVAMKVTTQTVEKMPEHLTANA